MREGDDKTPKFEEDIIALRNGEKGERSLGLQDTITTGYISLLNDQSTTCLGPNRQMNHKVCIGSI